MTEDSEAEWLYTTLSLVAAGSSLPSALLSASQLKSKVAHKAKMHIISGHSPAKFKMASHGWNTILRLLASSKKVGPTLAGETGMKLLVLLYENRKLVEEWEAKKHAYAFRGLLMMVMLSFILPFLIQVSPLLSISIMSRQFEPAPSWLVIWGLALTLISSFIYSTILNPRKNYRYILLPTLIYISSHYFVSGLVSHFFYIGA